MYFITAFVVESNDPLVLAGFVSAPRGLPLWPATCGTAPGGLPARADQQQRLGRVPAHTHGAGLPELSQSLVVPQMPAGAWG